MEIPFIGGAYAARNKNLNAQVCQNFYVEVDQTGAKNVIALVGCPGMLLWKTTGYSGEVRNFFVYNNLLHAIIGNRVLSFDPDKTASSLGTIGTSSGWVDVNNDGVYVSVFDSSGGWVLDGTTLTSISDTDLPTPSGSTYQDGYHIVSRVDTDQFFISAQDDPTSWDPTNYATAEGAGDILMKPISVQRQLWLIGTNTSEIWYNAGETFPFLRNPGGFIEIGSNSKRSIASDGNELLFLDNKNRVVRKVGLQLVPVSTYQIDYLISTMSNKSSSIGSIYTQEGHTFYELTFSSDDKTICYDLTTGFWHTRASGQNDVRNFANCSINFNNSILVGHYNDGNIYEYSFETYQDAGETKRAIRAAQCINNSGNLMFHNSFELDMETGVGDATTEDPQIMMQYSDDEGNTWSTEKWKDMGGIGEYAKRVKWRRLGKSRNRIYRVIVSDPVKRNITNAYLDGMISNA